MKNLYRILFILYTPLFITTIAFSFTILVIGDIITKISLSLIKILTLHFEIFIKLFLKNS